MFEPRYDLNTALLNNIIRIKNIVDSLNNQKFPELVLATFEKEGYALSAHASTSIEGNPLRLTDVRNLLKHHPAHVRDTEKEILNYNNALTYLDNAVSDKRALDLEFICAIQGVVVSGLLDAKNTGRLRSDHVVVNDPKKRRVAYLPPNPDDAQMLMGELVAYVKAQGDSVDPLILAGIFHKQFVVIHPFMDGNGRSTRLLTKYILAQMGLDTFRLFSFENYYNQDVTRYFRSVGVQGDYYEVGHTIDFTDWLIYFTGGIIDELLRVQKLLIATAVTARIAPYEKVIIDYIRKHGSISESEYARITDRARSTRISDFKRMVDKGMIERHNQGKATYYIGLHV